MTLNISERYIRESEFIGFASYSRNISVIFRQRKPSRIAVRLEDNGIPATTTIINSWELENTDASSMKRTLACCR